MSTQFFNPDQHLVFHSDKNGQMMSGGYAIQNLLFEKKVPLFAKWSGGGSSSGSSINSKRKHANGDDAEHDVAVNIIPDKFSDLFKDLAVPAGLFMMPPLFRPRNYMYKAESDDDDDKDNDKDKDKDNDAHRSSTTSESKQRKKHKHKHHNNDNDKDHYDMSLRGSDKDNTSSDDSHSGSDSGSDSDAADESKKKPYFRAISSDMFDKLISLVSPTDRIKVDKRTRKHRSKINNNNNNNNDNNYDEDGTYKFHDKKQNRRRNNKTKRNTNA